MSDVLGKNFKFTGDQLSFIGSVGVAAVAGQFSQFELWNPAASGVMCIVETIRLTSTGTENYCNVRSHNALVAAASTEVGNKYLGAAAPACNVTGVAFAAGFGTLMSRMTRIPLANYSWEYNFPNAEKIIIPPGLGLVLQHTVVNLTGQAIFEWIEVM